MQRGEIDRLEEVSGGESIAPVNTPLLSPAQRGQQQAHCQTHVCRHSIVSAILLVTTLLSCVLAVEAQRGDRNLLGLVSARDIADLTQLATEIAAHTMQSNAELINRAGRDEVRPLSLDARPSELFSQSLTNMMTPASQQFAQALKGWPNLSGNSGASSSSSSTIERQSAPDQLSSTALFSSTRRRQPAIERTEPLSGAEEGTTLFRRSSSPSSSSFGGGGGGGNDRLTPLINSEGMNSIMDLASTLLTGGRRTSVARGYNTYRDGGNNYENNRDYASGTEHDEERGSLLPSSWASGGGSSASLGGGLYPKSSQRSSASLLMPTLRQFFSDGDKNFGLPHGEGCLPFIGEFMRMIYGNCVRQADQRTWDAWGKEITNALMGGKIDLLRASKETCKKGAEREQCGQLKRAVSDCDIIASIQLASNMQRAVARCDELSGIVDQNPTTVMQQMRGLINGEVAQGFLNNFLG